MSQDKERILVVEDDRNLNRGICFALEKEGYEVEPAFSLSDAKAALIQSETTGKKNSQNIQKPCGISLVLLDLNLPDGDGILFCRELRENCDLPVIMLTARNLEVDEVLGLESGAADYITKPFSLSVLKARVRNAMRIYGQASGGRKNGEQEYEAYGSLSWKKDEMRFYKNGILLELSLTEYRLLSYFFENAGRTVTKEQILVAVWDSDGKFVDENTLPVNIKRLRAKLDKNEREAYIKTEFGVGYRFEG